MNMHNTYEKLFGLSGRVALVTGATKGLGRTFAAMLSEAGASVGLCSRSAEDAEDVAKSIAHATGNRVFGMGADVSKKAAVDELVARVQGELGR